MSHYKSYPLFKDVKNKFVRAYNLLQIAENIRTDLGAEAANKYLEQVEREALDDVAMMVHLVKVRGLVEVKKLVQAEIKGEGYDEVTNNS